MGQKDRTGQKNQSRLKLQDRWTDGQMDRWTDESKIKIIFLKLFQYFIFLENGITGKQH
jgi:hypothetical protein